MDFKIIRENLHMLEKTFQDNLERELYFLRIERKSIVTILEDLDIIIEEMEKRASEADEFFRYEFERELSFMRIERKGAMIILEDLHNIINDMEFRLKNRVKREEVISVRVK
jgi:hypothetical protein